MSAPLLAYMDESVHSKVVTIGGFVSSSDHWRAFSREWSKTLSRMGIQYLHMREFAHFRGQFVGWSKVRRTVLLKHLVRIIKCRVMFFAALSIDMNAYNKVFPAKLRKAFGDVYHFCLRECLTIVIVHCTENQLGERVDFTFDQNKKVSARAKRIFEGFRDDVVRPLKVNSTKLGTVSYEDDRVVVPLQAADFLSYEVNKHERGAERQSFQALFSLNGRTRWLGAAELKSYLAYLGKYEKMKPFFE